MYLIKSISFSPFPVRHETESIPTLVNIGTCYVFFPIKNLKLKWKIYYYKVFFFLQFWALFMLFYIQRMCVQKPDESGFILLNGWLSPVFEEDSLHGLFFFSFPFSFFLIFVLLFFFVFSFWFFYIFSFLLGGVKISIQFFKHVCNRGARYTAHTTL